ncbi:hypothetical protein C6380_03090 [Pseudomonas syringae pv. actinidiae]|nr:hypothetical protein D9N00_05975 [Pseudomonas syringae pv. actinidiae]AYL84027.1 hypothetical protein CN228_05575 [Pseudomonas syringae pv. actinidiae str. Shaanxi_M228]NAT28700.1 hypothetical protein [Pseudomonas syringae pv. actinidiae]NVL59637.1 hypothetical protein [Pseudomonas syringae pv. actinidiae]RJX61386.1 hypothetical protein C6380_03090 [Pseudomonas syringae pv. actinidiae]
MRGGWAGSSGFARVQMIIVPMLWHLRRTLRRQCHRDQKAL